MGIGYGDSIDRAIEVLLEVMKADDRIISEPAPQIVVKDLGESSVDLLLRCWTRRSDNWPAKCDLIRAVKETLALQGIEIPYPQRVVHAATAAKDES